MNRSRRRDITKIKPVRVKSDGDELPVKGHELIPELYTSIFLAASSGSTGKTTLLHHLCLQSMQRGDSAWVFSPTNETDPVMIDLKQKLERRGVNVHTFEDIIQDGVNLLEVLLKSIKEKKEEDERKEEEAKMKKRERAQNKHLPPKPKGLLQMEGVNMMFPEHKAEEEDKEPVVKPKRRRKFKSAAHHIILDDLPRGSLNEAKHSAVENLVRKNRHFGARCYISSQFILAISPSAMSNIGHFFIGKFFSEEHMKRLYNRLQLSITFNEFFSLYKTIMEKNHQFMHISRDGSVRVNFEKPLDLTLFQK